MRYGRTCKGRYCSSRFPFFQPCSSKKKTCFYNQNRSSFCLNKVGKREIYYYNISPYKSFHISSSSLFIHILERDFSLHKALSGKDFFITISSPFLITISLSPSLISL